jgi:protein-L-isoaspartate(D-aspartate) O-methyltransferase
MSARGSRALPLLVILLTALSACTGCDSGAGGRTEKALDEHAGARRALVDHLEASWRIRDAAVLKAMRKVRRHEFVSSSMAPHAYENRALPIAEGQTISQPYIVAHMTEALQLRGGEKVLEIGTGSGYQAAVLAEIAKDVFTIEIIERLGVSARKLLDRLGYTNIHYRIGDGYKGWPEEAPFDAIIVTAAPPEVPPVLKQQLRQGGRLVLPVGTNYQELLLITRTGEGFTQRRLGAVRFVPMVPGKGER